MTRIRWESRIGSIDAVVLIGGVASLLIWHPPAIIILAGAHLICGFLVALNKWVWGAMGVATLAIQVGIAWAAWRYVPSPVFEQLGASAPDWLTLIAAAIIFFGVSGRLLSAIGNNDRLADYIEQYGEKPV